MAIAIAAHLFGLGGHLVKPKKQAAMPTHRQIWCLPTGKRVCASRSAQAKVQACGSIDMNFQ